MKRRVLLLTGFAFISLALFTTNLAVHAQRNRFQARKEFLPFTRNLPSIDKVELLKYKTYGAAKDTEIEAAKILKGIEAKNLALLWRNQIYRPGTSACHNPIYGIKFFSNEKMIMYASICWDCNTIALETPYINETQYFDGKTKKGQQLLQLFRAAFPENK